MKFQLILLLQLVLTPCLLSAEQNQPAVLAPWQKSLAVPAPEAPALNASSPLPAPVRRKGPVRLEGHSFADSLGPFPALGVSYMSTLWKYRNQREVLEEDLKFLSQHGFHFFRMLSMVGHHPSWEGREIAPVPFRRSDDKEVPAMPEYWESFAGLLDLAWKSYGLRTEVTLFADAQLMPDREARRDHVRQFLEKIVPGREDRILLIEVANEAWQNGFPGPEGVVELRELAALLQSHTKIPVAITSNHDGSGPPATAFAELYRDNSADLATWHFSRDLGQQNGWIPVIDCWDYARLPGMPPVISNEPIGPGSSVDSESDPLRLVMAAAFAYTAGLPAYVFHSAAGVRGHTRFQETPGVTHFGKLLEILPPDVSNWQRYRVSEPAAQGNPPWSAAEGSPAALSNTGCSNGPFFFGVPLGIDREGLSLKARRGFRYQARDPLTGNVLQAGTVGRGDLLLLPQGPGALWVTGEFTEAPPPK